ncbi:MAG: Tm-1-like ATP-binding domain-containing protein [Desulfatiglandales bacterium]
MKTILVVATLDTKGAEVAFCREQIEAMGAKALLLDGGVLGEPTIEPDITREEVAGAAGTTIEQVRKIPAEGEAIDLQAQGAGVITLRLHKEGRIHGVLGIGGGMGTVLGTGAMRTLPIGVPKFMVSSQAGNPAMSRLVGTKDICMFHSVADVVGLNRFTRIIFTRACGGVVGMAGAEVPEEKSGKKIVALCAKGATEDANRIIRQRLADAGYHPMTFHCFGFGPVSLEQVIADGYIDGGVIELSSDWLDRIAGGSSFPPDDRYENAGRLGLPQVFVPGTCDLIAGPPGKHTGRKTHLHNKVVTSYRSSYAELHQVGREIGEKLSQSRGPVTVVIPMKGFSTFDRVGGPMYDPKADAGFIDAISAFSDKIKVLKVDAHILDKKFTDAVMDAFLENAAQV